MKPYTTIPTAQLSTDEWRRLRQRGIGGSDAAHVVLSPEQFRYADPAKIFREKTDALSAEEESLPCMIGHALEGLCARLFERETGRTVRRMNQMLVSREHPYMIADIDRKLCGVSEGLECKCVGQFSARRKIEDPETGESRWIDIFESGDAETVFTYKPEWYMQVQHYLSVTGWNKWHLAVIVLNNRFCRYEVARDEDLIGVLRESEAEFWNLVCKRENIWEV